MLNQSLYRLWFEPNGRIGRSRFWQGLIVLTVASFIIVAGQTKIGSGFGLLSYLLIYPYICVFGKRLHDIGRSAWWVIGLFFASLIVQFILTLFTEPIFRSPETVALIEKMAVDWEAGNIDMVGPDVERLNNLLLIPNLISVVVGNFVLGFFLGRIESDAGDNQYGPAE